MINSLHLQGFKSFHDVALPLGPLTVIVGTNASGKSNLRDAFRFLHGISLGFSLADIVGEKRIGGEKIWGGIRGGLTEIASFGQSSFTLETELPIVHINRKPPYPSQYHYGITVGVSSGSRPLRVVRESLYDGDRMVYDSHPASDPPNQESPDDLLVRLGQAGSQTREATQSFRSDHPVLPQFLQFVLNSDPSASSRSTSSDQSESHDMSPASRGISVPFVLWQIESMRFLDLLPEAMTNPSIPGQPLGDRGENLSSALQAICEDSTRKRAMMEWIRQLTPLDVADLEFLPDHRGKVLLMLVEANGQKTSADSASDGTLRFLAMIAALMAPDIRPTSPDRDFYFIEEIENGIHPTRLSLLLQLIEQYTSRGNVQVVATTHSPQLLAMLSPEAREHAFLAYRFEDEKESHLTRILDIPTASEVLARQNLARLHESGWLENTVAFARKEDAEP